MPTSSPNLIGALMVHSIQGAPNGYLVRGPLDGVIAVASLQQSLAPGSAQYVQHLGLHNSSWMFIGDTSCRNCATQRFSKSRRTTPRLVVHAVLAEPENCLAIMGPGALLRFLDMFVASQAVLLFSQIHGLDLPKILLCQLVRTFWNLQSPH